MSFPSKKELSRVRNKLKGVTGTRAQPENPTPLQKFRHEIQQKFVAYKQENEISQRELSNIIGIDEGKVSKLLRNHLEEFSTDRLIKFYEKINPKLKLEVG